MESYQTQLLRRKRDNAPVASKNLYYLSKYQLLARIAENRISIFHARSRAPLVYYGHQKIGKFYLATYHSKVHDNPIKNSIQLCQTRGVRVTLILNLRCAHQAVHKFF